MERPSFTSWASLFGFGAVVISIFDGFHTHSGTTRYPNTLIWDAAWWTPLIFGLSTGVGGPAYALGYRALGGTKPPPSWAQLAPAFAAFGGLYAFSGYYHGPNAVKLAVLAAAAGVLYALLDKTLPGLVMMLATAATGPLVEVALVHMGSFEHLQPDFLGIPMWLPALYACSAPIVGQGARRWLS